MNADCSPTGRIGASSDRRPARSAAARCHSNTSGSDRSPGALAFGPRLAKRRDEHDAPRSRSAGAMHRRRIAAREVRRASLADDQVAVARASRVPDGLAMIEIRRQRRRTVRHRCTQHRRQHRPAAGRIPQPPIPPPTCTTRKPLSNDMRISLDKGRTNSARLPPVKVKRPRCRQRAPRPCRVGWSPTNTQRAGSSSHARIRSSSMPGAGLRQSLARR